ncbi:reverse transcriptase-like protein, partial [Candidatus Dojkabacteria bacterium]|nr:reverse transcriptase-like protein [Candidatus Dojkabacteria bacterium]
MKPLFDKITSLIAGFDSVTFTHVPRAENSFADKLVNIALDAKLS